MDVSSSIAAFVVTFASAELFATLRHSTAIQILLKNNQQRTADEREQVRRGLFRCLVIELTVFVPASAVLALAILRPMLAKALKIDYEAAYQGSLSDWQIAFYSLLGIVSYGFPYASVRHFVIRAALHTLSEFAAISSQRERGQVSVEPPKKKAGKHA